MPSLLRGLVASRLRLVHELLHQAPEFGGGCVAGHDFVVANACPAESANRVYVQTSAF